MLSPYFCTKGLPSWQLLLLLLKQQQQLQNLASMKQWRNYNSWKNSCIFKKKPLLVISDVSWTYETHYPHALAANVSPKFYLRCFVQYENSCLVLLFCPFSEYAFWVFTTSQALGIQRRIRCFLFDSKPSGPLWSARKYRQTDYSKTVQCMWYLREKNENFNGKSSKSS